MSKGTRSFILFKNMRRMRALSNIFSEKHDAQDRACSPLLNAKEVSEVAEENAPVVLDSFRPLLQKLETALIVEGNEYCLIGEVTEAAWKSLQEYTSTVEVLFVSDSNHSDIQVSDATYFRLGQLQGTTAPMFPKLSRLHISNTVSPSLPHMLLMFSPSLKTIEVTGLADKATPTFASLLKWAGTEALLTKLVLDSVNLTPEVVKGVAHCRHLEVLELRNFKPQNCNYLNAFIYLPRLKCLTVNVDDRNLHSSRPPTMQPQAKKFRSLSKFHFKGGFPMLQTIANDLIRAPHLRSMQVELTKYPISVTHTKSYQPFHNNLCFSIGDLLRPFSIASSAAVESVTMTFNSDDKQANESLPRHAVSILSNFSNLRHLEISGIGMFALNDALNDALSDLAPLWSKIQTLHLPLADNCFQNAPKVGHSLALSNLQRIAQSCPELVSFRAPIAIPDDLTLFTAKVLHHPLTSLSVGSRRSVTQPVDTANMAKYLARCLCAMFPNLRNIYVHQNYNPDFWNEVRKLVELCNDVQGFDRMRALASSLEDGR